jgi:hypothetical protein
VQEYVTIIFFKKKKLDFFSREATTEEEKSELQYQRLRPGLDAKKGIPDDGHRGWKKYGNKTIQNANFCRYFHTSFLTYTPILQPKILS